MAINLIRFYIIVSNYI